ncbi:hypothetical protein IAU59_005450 [Kwoniella sp. CBS 9459]
MGSDWGFTKFGVDPISIHKRKFGLLRKIQTLLIDDWEGATDLAIGLGLKEQFATQTSGEFMAGWNPRQGSFGVWWHRQRLRLSEGIDRHRGKLDNVRQVAFGHDLMVSDALSVDLCRANGIAHTYIAHPAVYTLTRVLKPTHLCLPTISLREDWEADSDIEDYHSFLAQIVDQWPLTSISWHDVQHGGEDPWIPFSLPKARLFLRNCPNDEAQGAAVRVQDTDQPVGDCSFCTGALARWLDNTRADAELESEDNPGVLASKDLEIANLTCLGNVKAEDIATDGSIIKRKKQHKKEPEEEGERDEQVQEDPGPSKTPHTDVSRCRVSLTTLKDAEPCICCGQK